MLGELFWSFIALHMFGVEPVAARTPVCCSGVVRSSRIVTLAVELRAVSGERYEKTAARDVFGHATHSASCTMRTLTGMSESETFPMQEANI